MPLPKLLDTVRQSLWFLPATWVVACAAAAFVLVAVDHATPDFPSDLPLIFGGGPEGARGLLSAIASSMITVVGVVFSITIVALQLASSQYSPRVLRNFIRDRPSQLVLGAFIGSFVYSLLVLRTVRSGDDQGGEFVPAVAVTGAIVLAIVAVGMLVFFVHHIATQMQASRIVAAVTSDALEELERQSREGEPDVQPPGNSDATGEPTGEPTARLSAVESGYLQYVEMRALVSLAERRDVVIRMEVGPGGWVQRGAPLFSIWGASDAELGAELRRAVTVATQRVVYQDPDFALQQLVDVAVKALSPGVNDPTTAVNALHRIVELLVAAGRTPPPVDRHTDGNGVLRLIVPRGGFAQLLRTAFEEITHFGGDNPRIRRELAAALELVEKTIDPRYRTLAAQATVAVRRGLAARAEGPGS